MSDTPLPRPTDFMAAGIDLAAFLEIQRRWPVLTEGERQIVVRRVVPLRDKPLDDLLS